MLWRSKSRCYKAPQSKCLENLILFSFLRLSAAEKISDLVDRIDDSVQQLGLISFSSIEDFFPNLEIEMDNETVEQDDNDEV